MPAPQGVDLEEIAAVVSYVGSPEHKTFPSFAGPPRPRADATKCDPELNDRDELTSWLRSSVRAGRVGAPWEGQFPRYVWHPQEKAVYEARLVNSGLGEYKGYLLDVSEWPEGLE